MTNPGGPDEGFDLGPIQQVVSIFGAGGESQGTGLTGLNLLEQPFTEDLLKSVFIQGNESIDGPLGLVYNGLRSGISLPLAILEALAKKLLGLPEGTMFLSVEHVISVLQQVPGFELFSELISNLLSGAQPVNWLSLFGFLPGLLPVVPVGNVSNTTPTLLLNGGFDGSASVADNPFYDWDVAVGRTAGGSARRILDGTTASLWTTDGTNPVAVAPNQTIHLEAHAAWADVVATGNPFRLYIATYNNGVFVAQHLVDSIADPGTNSTSFSGNVDGWVELSGEYTVPASGVNAFALKLTAHESATSGTLHFDDADAIRPADTLPQEWITGLVAQWTSLFNIFGGSGAGLTQVQNFVTNLLKLFDVFNIVDLAVDPSEFDPMTILSGMVTNLINPLGLLQDDAARQALHQFADTIAEALGDIPFFGELFGLEEKFNAIFDRLLNVSGNAGIAVTSANPAIVAESSRNEARLTALEGAGNGIAEHFDNPDNWIVISGEAPNIVGGRAWGNEARSVSYYAPGGVAKKLSSNHWHIQFSLAAVLEDQDLIDGQTIIWVGNITATDYIGILVDRSFSGDTDLNIVLGTSPSAWEIRGWGINNLDEDDVKQSDVVALNYEPTANTFTLRYIGQVIQDSEPWEDDLNEVTHDADHWFIGMTQNGQNDDGKQGLGADDLSAYDVVT